MRETAVVDRAPIAAGVTGRGGGWVSRGGRDDGGGVSQTPQRAYLTGMVIALGGITMFFVALVSAAVVRRGAPSGDWQPLRAGNALWQILALNTLVLVASSFALGHSRSRGRLGDERGFRRWWLATSVLGVIFLAGQVLAWRQMVAAGLYLATNPDSSFFYLITAAHGVHLTAGIAALLVVAFRPARRMARTTAVRITAIYWHAMDAIWIFLFLFLVFGGRA